MKFDDLVAISGTSGLFKMLANRPNGLIVEDLNDGKRKFVSARKYQFTPLATIGIYTQDDDTRELRKVFESMAEKYDSLPPVSTNASPTEISNYFAEILPDYDRERVFIGDVKKVIKWFNFLYKHDILSQLEPAQSEEETEETEAENSAENTEEADPTTAEEETTTPTEAEATDTTEQ